MAAVDVVPLPARRRTAQAALAAMRPRQWSKNLVLFAGIVFAAKLSDGTRWLEAIAGFAAYCAAASAAYLLNDVRDAPHDRLHPVKRERPVASCELAETVALLAAAGLAATALAAAGALGTRSFLFMLAFLALQGAYTVSLKHVPLIDVAAIAGLFVVRAAAGAEAVHVRISPWLLICTALLALFLALAKRRGELVLVGAAATPGRPVLTRYSLVLVDRLVRIVAASTVASYALYTLLARDSKAMAATIPFVAFGVFRYMRLIDRDERGEEPESVLVSDGPLIATLVLWTATCAAILATT